ncbi:MAG: xanthine phosphoribosyltransferase [Clostridiales bacterium]|nr:xanthine phosphoribosyltransferase [Clostridiales bacterium]
MKLLEERILQDGKVIGGDVLKVDSFLNHQMDPALFKEMAIEWKRLYDGCGINKILTIEASGIGIACIAGLVFECPVVFAKKSKTSNTPENSYSSTVKSFTRGTVNDIYVSQKYLNKGDRVLVIDDFMATGEASRGLADIVRQSGAELVGIGIAIEKAFQPGGDELRAMGIRVESLARISEMSTENGIEFC